MYIALRIVGWLVSTGAGSYLISRYEIGYDDIMVHCANAMLPGIVLVILGCSLLGERARERAELQSREERRLLREAERVLED